MSNEMRNIYAGNVSWFCYEGSINLYDNRDETTCTLDDEFDVYGEDEDGKEGTCSVCVVSLLESAHVALDEKDTQIEKLTRLVELIANAKVDKFYSEDGDVCIRIDADFAFQAQELLSELKREE